MMERGTTLAVYSRNLATENKTCETFLIQQFYVTDKNNSND